MNINYLKAGDIIRGTIDEKPIKLMICRIGPYKFVAISLPDGNRWIDDVIEFKPNTIATIDYKKALRLLCGYHNTNYNWKVKVGKHYVGLEKFFGIS